MKRRNRLVALALGVMVASAGFAQTLMSTLVDGDGKLSNDVTTLTDPEYRMNVRVYVGDGQVLNIAPGTVIKAETGTVANSKALIVAQGGRLNAIGTKEEPIIFTAVGDPLDGSFGVHNKELWGGVILLGGAYNNILAGDGNPETSTAEFVGVANGRGNIEGLEYPNSFHQYGALEWAGGDSLTGVPVFVNDGNAGTLKYVSIRHGGVDIGEANEINGLTCGSCGSGTTLENIEIVSNGDDGVEFFGGSADLKYASIQFVEDDYIDWDQGYTGRIQFVLGVQLPPTEIKVAGSPVDTIQYGDNGVEADGDDGERYGALAGLYMSHPYVSNITIIGAGASNPVSNGDKGLELKERTEGTIVNSIIAGFERTVDMEVTGEDNGQAGVDYGTELLVTNNIFLNCGGFAVDNSAENASGAWETQLGNENLVVSATNLIDEVLAMEINDGNNTVLDGFDAIPSAADTRVTTGLATLPYDDFFTQVAYKGAFDPTTGPWTDSWTLHETLSTDKTVVDCPTDVDEDGDTDIQDFLRLAAAFGNACATY